jgi:2-polyprenyl-6-methoxyphenol hydroxylase-like FAD-dependent oxidoreductase
VHPLAGQGVNLGFLDAAALAETLGRHLAAPHADAGDPVVLRRYERWRKAANVSTLAAMDALHRVFTSRLPGVSGAAGVGLGAVDRVRLLKTALVNRATGRLGDLPAAARRVRI